MLFDFEISDFNAAQNQFPQTDVKGCFYHLGLNMWKHIQSYGLQDRYNNNEPEFALSSALAFVLPNVLTDAFDALSDEQRNIYQDGLVQYFEESYTGRF